MFAPIMQGPPILIQDQMPQVMKRKRENEDLSSLRLEAPPMKRRTAETVTHVQVPTSGIQGLDVSRKDDREKGNEEHHVVSGSERREHPRNLEEELGQGSAHTSGKSGDDVNAGSHAGNSKPGVPIQSTNSVNTADLHQVIEAQFSLEILLKHKELRLIDQEFGKCQAALEQLRRCQMIPFPAISSHFEDMSTASHGSGPLLQDNKPYAPPWGVANGPYSRHYQRWLIPDPLFGDPAIVSAQAVPHAGKTLPARPMRGSKTENHNINSTPRPQRGSNNNALAALPHGYPEPKEQKGPMIVKRKADGKMVKLVCLDCRRSNFNSVQGFVNHCRIAHSRHFLDHQKAIEACGEEIDVDVDAEVGEMNNASSQAAASVGLVHPLIRSSGHLARATLNASSISPIGTPTQHKKSSTSVAPHKQTAKLGHHQTMHAPLQQASSTPTTSTPPVPSEPLIPSPQAPHLSALFARIGRGGNLNDIVNQAQTKPEIDLSAVSDEEDDENGDDVSLETPQEPQSRSTRGVLRGGYYSSQRGKSPMTPEEATPRPSISDGSEKPPHSFTFDVQHTYPFSYHAHDGRDHTEMSMLGHDSSPFNLSPNTTEAHTAPSLVSDDGDYDGTHSESEGPDSAEIDDEEDHFIRTEVLDHDDMDLAEDSSAHHHIGLGGKPHHPSGRRPSQLRAPLELHTGGEDQRHVGYASPARRVRRDSEFRDAK